MANLQISDALLVKKYVEGDENALTVLINRHQSKIFGFIYSKIPDRDISNDIFQDTFIKVIKTLKSTTFKFLETLISISHLRKTYRIGEEVIDALKDVSLNIYKNEYVALMGPSGSGKSTLMNMLGCLDSPTSGEYILNGLSVAQMSDN